MKRFLIYTIVSLTMLSCSGAGIGSKGEQIELYSDSMSTVQNGLELSFDRPTSANYFSSDNYSFSISLKIKNTTLKTISCKIGDSSVKKESTGVEYKANDGLYMRSFSLDPELTKTIIYNAEIPSSLETDKYVFSCHVDNCEINLHLYETPDELRELHTVTYIINGKTVYIDEVRDGRNGVNYVYDAPDHLKYCSMWYTDSNCRNQIYLTAEQIKTDLTVYGKLLDNLDFMTTSTDVYSFVQGVNHVPSDKVIVIPRQYSGKDICIGNFPFNGVNMEKLYIPDTVRKIYTGFDSKSGLKIYYEGNEATWKTLFFSASNIPPSSMVTFNTKSPY